MRLVVTSLESVIQIIKILRIMIFLVIGSPENLEPWEEDKEKEEIEGEMEKEEVWMTVKRVRRQDIETFNNIKVTIININFVIDYIFSLNDYIFKKIFRPNFCCPFV